MEFPTNLRNSILSRDPRGIINEFVNDEIDDSFDGMYFGSVVDVQDPLQKGRCRIRVYNLFPTPIPDTDLPWAIPDFGYAGSTKGAFIVPPVNTKVRVYFDRGDIYCPVYEAKGFSQNELPPGIATNYPETMILYHTDPGEYLSVDRTDKITKWHQASGFDIRMANGKIAMGNSSAELLDLLDQLLQALIVSVVPTPMGPQQLSEVTNKNIQLIKQKLATIKGTL